MTKCHAFTRILIGLSIAFTSRQGWLKGFLPPVTDLDMVGEPGFERI